MRHHRDAALHQKPDGLGHLDTALQLDRRSSGFAHQPRRIGKGLRRPLFIRAKRHINHQHGVAQATRDGRAMQNHHLHGDAQRRRQPVQHHSNAVTD